MGFCGPFTIEETTASNASLAPTTIAGKTISAAIIDASGAFSDVGGFKVAVQSNGTSYSLTALGFLGNSGGSLTYRRLTATSSSITAADSLLGSVTGVVTWYSATRGEIVFSKADGTWQNSVAQVE